MNHIIIDVINIFPYNKSSIQMNNIRLVRAIIEYAPHAINAIFLIIR